MKRIKKVSVTPLSDAAGSIIDSLYSGSNEVTNAPSIRAVKAALGQTFYATTASGSGSSYRYYTITDASLPAEPVNGMTIKVTFPATHSAYLVHLRLNSGNYHQCLTQDVTGASGIGSYPYITTNRVYELVYYNNSWYFLSAFNRIESSNIDFTTLPLEFTSGELAGIDPFYISSDWVETRIGSGTDVTLYTSYGNSYILFVTAEYLYMNANGDAEFTCKIYSGGSYVETGKQYIGSGGGLQGKVFMLPFTAQGTSYLRRFYNGPAGSGKRWGIGRYALIRVA